MTKTNRNPKELAPKRREYLLRTLKARFEKNMNRHKGLEWSKELQKLGEFDTKTSSWVKTPADIRTPGGALYHERRYGRIFAGHNGAQSYYGVRGFRGSLSV